MKKMLRKIIVLFFMLVSLYVVFSSIAVADPAVVSIVTDPEYPVPESTVKVTVNITGDNISSVTLQVSECTSETGSCINFHTIDMDLNADGEYEAIFTLKDKDGSTDYIEYTKFTIISNDVTYTFNENYKVDLNIDSGNNNQNGENGSTNNNKEGDKDKGIPGFEILTLLIALTIGIFLFKRMRLR